MNPDLMFLPPWFGEDPNDQKKTVLQLSKSLPIFLILPEQLETGFQSLTPMIFLKKRSRNSDCEDSKNSSEKVEP